MNKEILQRISREAGLLGIAIIACTLLLVAQSERHHEAEMHLLKQNINLTKGD